MQRAPSPSATYGRRSGPGSSPTPCFVTGVWNFRAGKRTRVQGTEDLLKPEEVLMDGKGGGTSPGLPVAIHSLGSWLPLSRHIL